MRALSSTVDLMLSADYNERFKAEYWQLQIRSDKLHDVLNKLKAGTLPFKPKCTYELLFTQWLYMQNYLAVLQSRAEIEGIDLND